LVPLQFFSTHKLSTAQLALSTTSLSLPEQTKRRPELGAEVQALCWGALGGFGTFAYLFSGWALEHSGPRILFGVSIASR